VPKVLEGKKLSDVVYKNEFEALYVLEQLIDKIIKEDFKNDSHLRDYVKKRIDGAWEVLRRISKDYFTDRELRSVVPSSEAIEKGPPREIKIKTLKGKEITVTIGADEDEFYHVSISRYRFKCGCQDALILSSTADKRLKEALQTIGVESIPSSGTIFYKYVLCKHTLAKIAKAMTNPTEGIGIINIDKEFIDTLRLALFAAYLRSTDSIDPDIVRNIYEVLRKRLR